MSTESAILGVEALGFPWPTADPFLFCVHHLDHYPQGNDSLGPAASLAGRQIGMDFAGKDGWRMYHGDRVPGFPRHPHRGFETITVANKGLIDHSDSLGATARFGKGDVQWMTAGRGIVHSEMFPLVNRDTDNPMEFFQLWLNLPQRSKLVEPRFTMYWAPTVPERVTEDASGRTTKLRVVTGRYGELEAPAPPPSSWAADPDHDVAIWTVELDPGAKWTLPAAPREINRSLYFYRGDRLAVGETTINDHRRIILDPSREVTVTAGEEAAAVLVLQGKPIAEPVAQHGPFVMNSPMEVRQAYLDYQKTGFGGWPWHDDGPVHEATRGRFAIHADGQEEFPQDSGSTS